MSDENQNADVQAPATDAPVTEAPAETAPSSDAAPADAPADAPPTETPATDAPPADAPAPDAPASDDAPPSETIPVNDESRTGFVEGPVRSGDPCLCPDGRAGTVTIFADNMAVCLPNQG